MEQEGREGPEERARRPPGAAGRSLSVPRPSAGAQDQPLSARPPPHPAAIPVFNPAPHNGTTTLPPSPSPPPSLTAAQHATPVVST